MPISLITHAYKASYKLSYSAPYQPPYKGLLCALVVTALLIVSSQVSAKAGAPAPTRQADEGQGPYKRLILRGVNLVSGEGAPTRGPVDIVIENDIITNIVSVGHPGVPIKPNGRPKTDAATKEMDLQGYYVLPGFIDMHGHIGGSADDIPEPRPGPTGIPLSFDH